MVLIWWPVAGQQLIEQGSKEGKYFYCHCMHNQGSGITV